MNIPLLHLQSLTVHLPFLEEPVIKDITLTLKKGSFAILLGGNGSGKSSLLKTLTNTYAPSHGTIIFKDKPLESLSAGEKARTIACLTQDTKESLFYTMTVLENCLLWDMRFDKALLQLSTDTARHFFHEYLATFNPKLSEKLDHRTERLSGGERQALVLALCLRYPPELLLLDEHTSALDPKTAYSIMKLTNESIHKSHITTIMATHNLNHALLYGDELFALKNGVIVFHANAQQKKELNREELMHLCY